VLAVFRISAIGGSGLGALCGGAVAGLYGLPASLAASAVISGLTAVVLALSGTLTRRQARHRDR
jgi:predicted MFS family arabinose efflux permease